MFNRTNPTHAEMVARRMPQRRTSRWLTTNVARRRSTVAMVAALLMATSVAQAQDTWYVDDDGVAGNECTSWADACPDLQTPLSLAAPGDEIWVAAGTYTPAAVGGARTATFQLVNGVAIMGGYAGLGNPDPDERDPALYETVLSGDLDDDDLPDFVNNEENSYHVVTGTGTDATAILNGVKITGGYANGSGINTLGGGMIMINGSATLVGASFVENSAYGSGGGLLASGHLVISDCTFLNNRALANGQGGGLRAGASDGGVVAVTRCTFEGNSAGNVGGGAHITDGVVSECSFLNNTSANSGGGLQGSAFNQPIFKVFNSKFFGNSVTEDSKEGGAIGGGELAVIGCEFIGNTALGDNGVGGAIGRTSSSTLIMNCLFSGNAAHNGGALGLGNETPSLINCVFSGNTARALGGALRVFGTGTFLLRNCIFWGNSSNNGLNTGESGQLSGSVSLDYCDVQGLSGALGGIGNIGADPLFVDADGADNMLGTVDDDLRLQPGSPCIDAADNAAVPADIADLDGDGDTAEPTPLDLDGNSRFVDDADTPDTGNGTPPIVDMGAFEAQGPGTPEELVEQLIEIVLDLNLPEQEEEEEEDEDIQTSLVEMLNAILQHLEETDGNDDGPACNQFQAFVNAVEAHSGKQIPEDDANSLIASAQEIVDLLGC